VLITALAALLAVPGAPARAQELIADLSRHLIQITSDFTGTELLVFGAIESGGESGGGGDVVVIVRGPREALVVRKKDRVMGIWINTESARFHSVPTFYGIASTRPLDEIGAPEMRRLMEIGLDGLRLTPDEALTPEEAEEFRMALIALQQSEGLYPTEPDTINVVGGRLFRAVIPFPASVPVGTYIADTFLIRDGEIVAAQSSPLTVDKAGFGADIFDFAHRQAALYGILAVIAAVLAGLAGNALFRRP